MLLAVVAVGVAIVSALLALTVWLRNPHSPYNVSFAIFALLLALWIPSNYFGSYQDTNTHLSFLFFADFTIGPFLALSFSNFGLEAVRFYRQKTLKINRVILTAVVVLATFFSLGAAFHQVSLPIYTPSNVLNTEELLYYPYNFFVGALALFGLSALIFSTIRAKKEYKTQTRFIFWGLLLFVTMIIAANIVFTEFRFAQTLSYFAVLIMLFSLSYSIIRHRLFDIRPIIARSVAYVLLLGSFAAIFAISLLAISAIFFQDQNVPISIKIAYIVLALLLAFIFQPLRKIFDKFTNRLFFRDYYEPQEVLDRLSNLLVGTVETDAIEKGSIRIIKDAINPTFIHFLLASSEDEGINEILKELSKNQSDLLLSDALDEQRQTSLRALMRKHSIAVAVRLQTKTAKLGFIIMGVKQSGAIYSEADLKLLGIVADEIALSLQNALRFEEIQHFNITLRQKIDEATKELKRVNHKLRELDKSKDEFISMASHQLRTPLTSVKGYLSMMLEGDTGKITDDQRAYIKRAFDQSQKMVYLIADLLNVSRLQTGKFVIENMPTDLAKVVQDEIDQLTEQAGAKEISLTYHKPDSFPVLNLDETKIRQVVMNFLDNAIYYTPNGGKVTVEVQSTPESVSYSVTDTGIGVPKTLQHHLFSKFYRADNARKMRPDGTGLGLFMAKKVVSAQGGAIIFSSEEGKGSTFGFSFPRARMEIKGNTPKPTDEGQKVTDKTPDKPAADSEKKPEETKPAEAALK